MKKNEIIKLLKPKCNGYDLPLSLNIELIAEILVNKQEEAINYTHCCTELRDKETPKIEDWLKDNFKRLDQHSFTNTHEDTVWLRSELVEVYNQLHP